MGDLGSFKDILKEFLNSQILIYALYAYLFGLIFYIVYSMLNYFKYYSKMKATIINMYNQMTEQERARADEERKQRDIIGEGTKKDWLASIDEKLAYSGIKEKIRWITTEIYLMFVLVIAIVITILLTVKISFIAGVLGFFITIALFEFALTIVITVRNKKTESMLLQFMNIVDNFSKTSNDLISILEKSSKYIDEPLSSQIYDAVIDAKNTGNSSVALHTLQDKVKNKHFKVLIRNLEISSRFETNYSEIVEDCRDIFHDYIKNEKEKHNIRVNGLLEILTMAVCGGASVYLIADISDSGNVIQMLLNGGVFGYFILGYIIAAIVITIYVAVFKVLRNK